MCENRSGTYARTAYKVMRSKVKPAERRGQISVGRELPGKLPRIES